MTTNIIACINQKGGVGKTTTVANIGFSLANMGRKVLLVDFDAQSSLTYYLNVGVGKEGYDENAYIYGMLDLLVKDLDDPDYMTDEIEMSTWEELIDKCVCTPTYWAREEKKDVRKPFGFDLIPASILLTDFELYLIKNHMDGNETLRLTRVLNKVLEYRDYDYIIIDCNPTISILSLNAVAAATAGCVIPTNLDLLSTKGVVNLLDNIADIQTALMFMRDEDGNIIGEKWMVHYGVLGVVLNLYKNSRVIDTKIENDLKMYYPIKIFESQIPESAYAKRALFGGQIYSQIYKKAKDAYDKLAKEIENQIIEKEEIFQKYGKQALVQRVGEVNLDMDLEEEHGDE